MPDLLIELFSEEIPARMQRRAAEDLRKLVTDALVDQGFVYEGARAYATPRRLALHVVGLPAQGQDVREERKGPRVGAPDAAIQGFLKSAGLASIDQASVQSDPKKGEFYVAVIDKPGRPTSEVVAEIMPRVIRSFPWPKSMRWGASSAQSGSLSWVRPLHSAVCTFGPETEDPEVVRFTVDGIEAGDVTYGHRFLAPGPIRVKHFDDYAAQLERAKVVLDADRRKDIILHDARDLAFAQGLQLVEDEGLLEEVAGLVEWPVVLMGSFDESFLDIPPEVIRATIRANQKCFVLRPHQSEVGEGALANRFILVSNVVASDGGRAIVAGNERVVRARLSDAKFFWETDKKVPLESRLEKLKNIVFHEKLGTQYERVERIAALARELAPLVGADPDLAERAARLAKADLVTEMVGEFPELQGLMGRYYATLQGEDPRVAAAIEDHYKPLGPSDRVPTEPVAVAVALADKIDTLFGFWIMGEKPTGSKDPYALRRAGLGIIRLILDNSVRLPILYEVAPKATSKFFVAFRIAELIEQQGALENLAERGFDAALIERMNETILSQAGAGAAEIYAKATVQASWQISIDLLSFLADRLKVYLRDQGARHDLIDAVFALGAPASPLAGEVPPQGAEGGGAEGTAGAPSGTTPTPGPSPQGGGEGARLDDLLMIVRRVEALGRFLDTDDGKNLLAGTKRAANILRIEEKKDGRTYGGEPDLELIQAEGLPEERALAEALDGATREAREAVSREDFQGAMRALSTLREPVDAFFEKVTVNADDARQRENRLRLLGALRQATREVADFGRISG